LRRVVDVAGYLGRLGLPDPGPPSVAALAAIHRAQVERVAYNNVDIQLGRPVGVTPDEAVDRVVTLGRSGYCFQLNAGFGALLRALGYQVRGHRGGVWTDPADVPLQPFANHLALTVQALPTSDNPGGSWFVDAGLGDGLHEPMPLRAGEVRQGPFTYSLAPSPVLAGGWRFRHDPSGSFAAMDFDAGPAVAADFAASHRYLSTSATSPFVRYVLAQRRDVTGVDKLISCMLSRQEGAAATRTLLRTPAQWFAALVDVFGLTLDDIGPDERAELWRRARTAQDEWERERT
jgi:arylamine N-acetyltransferase